jgi:hypothetical protein
MDEPPAQEVRVEPPTLEYRSTFVRMQRRWRRLRTSQRVIGILAAIGYLLVVLVLYLLALLALKVYKDAGQTLFDPCLLTSVAMATLATVMLVRAVLLLIGAARGRH